MVIYMLAHGNRKEGEKYYFVGNTVGCYAKVDSIYDYLTLSSNTKEEVCKLKIENEENLNRGYVVQEIENRASLNHWVAVKRIFPEDPSGEELFDLIGLHTEEDVYFIRKEEVLDI